MFRTIVVGSCLVLSPAWAIAQQPAADPAPSPGAADAPVSEEEAAAAQAAEIEKAKAAFEASLERRTGKVTMASAHVTLNVPDGFYFLDRSDARDVLVDGWGNPPDSQADGMLFPADTSPIDENAWGVVLTFDETGYISDEDASKIDYDVLIEDMRDGQTEENKARVKASYPPITIIGWAAKPRYDAAAHKLYWAKELQFGDEPVHTLNYDMRVLGRKGVLSLNFVAAIEQLPEIESASPRVLAIPEFDDGFRYQDFNAATDEKADFGIAGLIAGGAAGGLLLAKKTGLIGIALLFLKKAWFLVVMGLAGAGAFLRKLFGGKAYKAEVSTQEAEEKKALSTDFFDKPASGASSGEPPPSV